MKPGKCNRCGQQIVWFHLARKKWVAVDPELVETSDTEYDARRMGHHYANCKEMTKRKPACGYIIPEGYPTQPLSPEALANSQFLRAIPEDEEQRIGNLIERR